MNFLRVSIVASMLFVLAPLFAPSAGLAEWAAGHVLTGELVVTNATRNQFRLVGHAGSFTAPAGIPVDALDGKPVQVEFSSNGRVLQISTEPPPPNSITHSEEIVSGQLVVRDPVLRTFTFAGDDRTYTAPPDLDVRPYGGHMVEVRLNEAGRVVDIGFAKRSDGNGVGSTCLFNGRSYSDGASVCQSGAQYRCESGSWRGLGTTCASEGAKAFGALRGCTIADATVASGSTVCRSGTTFRCSDGSWVNIGAPCS